MFTLKRIIKWLIKVLNKLDRAEGSANAEGGINHNKRYGNSYRSRNSKTGGNYFRTDSSKNENID